MSSSLTETSPPPIIAFTGVEGAYADMACRKAYPQMQTQGYTSFDEVLEAVEYGEVELGMIPIENSHAGRVAEVHNLLPYTEVHIIAEVFQRIEHCLAAPVGSVRSGIKEVHSHPQALAQCKQYLKRLKVQTQQSSNTALAAKDVQASGETSRAVICSTLAAKLYGLEILEENIEDSPDNTTIFIVVSKTPIHPPLDQGPVITTLFFSIRNIPGALYKALGGFATNNINLVKLESYIPGGHSSSAQFFISFQGHPEQKRVQWALDELGFFTKRVRVLGVYQAATERVFDDFDA